VVSDEGFGEIFQKNENRVTGRGGRAGVGGVFGGHRSCRCWKLIVNRPPDVDGMSVVLPGFRLCHQRR
jgi:hypothetical protein